MNLNNYLKFKNILSYVKYKLMFLYILYRHWRPRVFFLLKMCYWYCIHTFIPKFIWLMYTMCCSKKAVWHNTTHLLYLYHVPRYCVNHVVWSAILLMLHHCLTNYLLHYLLSWVDTQWDVVKHQWKSISVAQRIIVDVYLSSLWPSFSWYNVCM
mgnify:CR=1 FL=1